MKDVFISAMKLILCFLSENQSEWCFPGRGDGTEGLQWKTQDSKGRFLQKAASCGTIGSGTEREELNEGSSLARCFMVHTLQIIESSLKINGRVSSEILLCQPEESNHTADTMPLPFPAQLCKFQTERDTTFSSQLPQ